MIIDNKKNVYLEVNICETMIFGCLRGRVEDGITWNVITTILLSVDVAVQDLAMLVSRCCRKEGETPFPLPVGNNLVKVGFGRSYGWGRSVRGDGGNGGTHGDRERVEDNGKERDGEREREEHINHKNFRSHRDECNSLRIFVVEVKASFQGEKGSRPY